MLQLSGEKMSKSLGNIVSIRDFLKEHDADAMRMLVLTGSYRAPLTFTDESVGAAENAVERLRTALRPAPASAAGLPPGTAAELASQAEDTKRAFTEAMDDDFNTAGALAAIFELVRAINTARDGGASAAQLQPAQDVLRELTGVLGLRLAEKQGQGGADKFIDLLVDVRTEARKQKLWTFSDLIRDKLQGLGITIEDSKEGTSWRWS
jgi:cysteinyl-tRNA synthetase